MPAALSLLMPIFAGPILFIQGNLPPGMRYVLKYYPALHLPIV